MLRLAIRYEDKVRYFPVPRETAHLGSAADNDLVAPFPGISRQHAIVRPSEGGVLLSDLGSTNGLIRDGRRLDEVLLTLGKTVLLGHATLALEDLSSSDAETGLPLGTADSPSAGSPSASATGALTPPGSSPAVALRFVREVEQGLTQAGLLARARIALGAETLLTFFRSGSDTAVTDCAGPLPAEEALAEMDSSGNVLLAGRPDGPFLAAWLEAPPEPWQRDFFEYLGDKLLPEGIAPLRGSAPVSAVDALRFPPGMVIGTSPSLRSLLDQIRATVHSDLAMLLTGETGTGKELFARLVHASGPHGGGPFIAINCAAIPGDLLEAELFGIGGRVATGVDPRPGLFTQASGGSIFLDEIGDMPERLQAKMLRVLQEREVLPLGATTARKIDVRVLSASNRDLGQQVREKTFRADLYYRLRGLELYIPPLRERREDLPSLILAFASRAAEKYRKRIRGVSRRALALLLEHDWPGNIRELQSEVERAVLLCPDGGTLQREHFGDLPGEPQAPAAPAVERHDPASPEPKSLQARIDDLERQAILEALAAAKGNKAKAARSLGITRNGLALKMRRLSI